MFIQIKYRYNVYKWLKFVKITYKFAQSQHAEKQIFNKINLRQKKSAELKLPVYKLYQPSSPYNMKISLQKIKTMALSGKYPIAIINNIIFNRFQIFSTYIIL